jgi:hypothetical protein
MAVAEKVYQSVLQLPEPFQAEVLNFTEYLLLKAQRAVVSEDESVWPSLSLALAMRGMEDEEMPEYTLADLKERFSLVDSARKADTLRLNPMRCCTERTQAH